MQRNNFVNGPEPGERSRVNAAEAAALAALCKYESINKSEAIRLALREAAKKRGLWPPELTGVEHVATA